MPSRFPHMLDYPRSCAVHTSPESIQSKDSSHDRAPIRLVITQSARVAPRVYRLAAPNSADSAVITIRGDDITVDFAARRWRAAIRFQSGPRQRTRCAGRWRTQRAHPELPHPWLQIWNPRASHEEPVVDRQRSELQMEAKAAQCIEHESLIDWLSFHHNEKDEWAALRCGRVSERRRGRRDPRQHRHSGNERTDARADQWASNLEQQLFVQLRTRIGLYRSSGNSIMHNRVDYDVRGYSDRFYRRGQDAADLLDVRAGNKNVVAFNSMTHGGDGVFSGPDRAR